jgi:arylsulfatase A-like enzyme
MKKWIFIGLGFISAAALFYCAGCGEKSKHPDPSYNLVIYLVDALRPDHLGCYGSQRNTSPFLDQFSKKGIVFHEAYAVSDWTRPSVGTLFTSLYPSFHGAVDRPDKMKRSVVTLAEVLKNEGYQTSGYIANGNVFGQGLNFDKGFDDFTELASLSDRHGSAAEILEMVKPWLHEQGAKPFFLYIHTVDPHDPYFAPNEYINMYKDKQDFYSFEEYVVKSRPHIGEIINTYDATVRYSDEVFGQLIEELQKLDLMKDTVVVFLSDHGEEFLEHGGLHHGGRLYQEQIHIPLILWIPGYPKGKQIENYLVSILDLSPTVLDILDIPVPSPWQGKSALPLIKRKPDKEHFKEVFGMEKLDEFKVFSIRNLNHQYILYMEPAFEEMLFNVKEDPFQQKNMAAEQKEVLFSIRDKMMNFIADTSPGFHVGYFVGDVDDQENPGTLSIQTDGVFEDVIHNRFVHVELNEKENQMSVAFTRENDSLSFSLVPESAALNISQVEDNPKEFIPFVLGNKDRVVGEFVEIKGDHSVLLAEFFLPGATDILDKGIHIWRIPLHEQSPFKPDKKTLENLKTLGYIR